MTTALPIRAQAALMDEIAEGDPFLCYEVTGKLGVRIFNWQDRTPAIKFAEAFGDSITVAPIAGRKFHDPATMIGLPDNFFSEPAPKLNSLVSVPGEAKRVRVVGIKFDWFLNPIEIRVKIGGTEKAFAPSQVQW